LIASAFFLFRGIVSQRRCTMLIGVVGWIVLGTVAGFIASKVVPLRGDDPRMGIAMGAIGGLVGGWLYSWHSGSAVTPFNSASLFYAALVAVLALVAWHGWRWQTA
jgi:uncharacterized membrane protein YeaQ/YmgE (transglycosylase-associated protein family)